MIAVQVVDRLEFLKILNQILLQHLIIQKN
jgi:hypothetical protein